MFQMLTLKESWPRFSFSLSLFFYHHILQIHMLTQPRVLRWLVVAFFIFISILLFSFNIEQTTTIKVRKPINVNTGFIYDRLSVQEPGL
jgi:hypothetical protein